MKNLYMITLHLDEDSVYFTEMTDAQAKAMAAVLIKWGQNWDILEVRESPGFHKYEHLLKDFREL